MATRQQIETSILQVQQQIVAERGKLSDAQLKLANAKFGATTVVYNQQTFRISDLNRQILEAQKALDGDPLDTSDRGLTGKLVDLNSERTWASTNIDGATLKYGPSRDNTVIRDYRHAARIFTDDNFRLSPKYGFLFYVEFDFNPLITNVSNTAARELGVIVKSATLPKFTIDTKTHNAYNRKNIVQNSIKYDPVQISFHDDQSDNVRNFWYDYYSFFFRDPDYASATYNTPHKYQSRSSFDWGYSPRRQPVGANLNGHQAYQYIQAIRIYSLYQKNFSEYQLVNPTITAFKHGDHVNGETSLLSHEMTIQYETVKYLTGYTTANNVGGFIDLHYDTTPSPLSGVEGTDLIPNGQGGYSRAPDTITDLAGISPLFTDATAPIMAPGFGLVNTTGSAFGGLFGVGTALSTSGGTNIGGFSVPSLGSLTQGITNMAQVQQQLQAQASNIVGGVVSSAANGIIGGLAAGLGPNGGATINLITAAIQNPQAALATVTNMAATYAMQQVGSYVTNLTQPLIDQASGFIKDQVGELTSTITGAFSDIGGEIRASLYEATFDTAGYSDLF